MDRDGLVVTVQNQGDITLLLAQVELAQVVRQVGHVLHLTHHRHRRERLLAGHRYLLSGESEGNRNLRTIVKLRLGSGTQAQSGSNSGSVTQAQ